MPDDKPELLRVRYRLHGLTGEAAAERAEALRFEQTVEVPPEVARDPFVREQILPRVEALEPDPAGGTRLTLAVRPHVTAHDPAELLNVLFGNCSLQDDVSLEDVELPASLCRALGGPRHGIAGLRRLTGVEAGPLTCSALKPMGLGPEALAELCGVLARAGIDVVKDDHGLADHPFCGFEARVRACQAAVDAAARETGRRVLYAPNLMGAPPDVARQLEQARAYGVRAALLAPMLLGLPTLAGLRRDGELALLAHPSFSFAGGPRLATDVLLGTLFRAFGADAVIFPHAGGRFERFGEQTCRRLARRLRAPLHGLAPSLPVPAGGMSVARVGELVSFYGTDAMLLVGGSLLRAGPNLLAEGRAFVAAVRRAGERLAKEEA